MPDGLVQVCLGQLEVFGELQAGDNELLHLLVHPGDHAREGELLGEALLLQVGVLVRELGGNVAVLYHR